MVSAGMTCIKYLLFCFNLIFAISGIAILTVGAIIHACYQHYTEFVDPNIESAPLALVIVGVIVFIVAFFGCCGAVKENHCMIITFSVFIMIIFSLELAAGIAGYVRRSEVESMLKERLNDTMYSYYTKPEIKRSWDIMQHELTCCGMHGPNDWRNVVALNNTLPVGTLPHTCCPDIPANGNCSLNSRTYDKYYEKPCLNELQTTFMHYGTLIGGVGIGIASIQLFGVIFACFLARSIRKEYETV